MNKEIILSNLSEFATSLFKGSDCYSNYSACIEAAELYWDSRNESEIIRDSDLEITINDYKFACSQAWENIFTFGGIFLFEEQSVTFYGYYSEEYMGEDRQINSLSRTEELHYERLHSLI